MSAALPWERWEASVAEVMPLYAQERTTRRQELRAWVHVFTAWSARVMSPAEGNPIALLRCDRPPLTAAPAWWTVLAEASGVVWTPAVHELLRACRTEYIETVHWAKSVDEAVRRAEAKWDQMCNALYPGTFPATAAETFRRIERRLEEVIALRTHAIALLRESATVEASALRECAAQLYAVDEPEFERELRWVSQVRAALEGTASLPKGTAYSYVDPVRRRDPEPDVASNVDPFAFESSTPPSPKVEASRSVQDTAESGDPFDFETAVTGTRS